MMRPLKDIGNGAKTTAPLSRSVRLNVCRRYGQPRPMTPVQSPRFMWKHGVRHIVGLSPMNTWIPSLSTGASRHGYRISSPLIPQPGSHRNLMPLSGGSQLDRAAIRMVVRRWVRLGRVCRAGMLGERRRPLVVRTSRATSPDGRIHRGDPVGFRRQRASREVLSIIRLRSRHRRYKGDRARR